MNSCQPTPSYNTTIFKGVAFQRSLRLLLESGVPFDITNYEVRAELRVDIGAAEKIDFDCALDNDPTTGRFTIALTPSGTGSMEVRDYVYDIILLLGGAKIRRLVKGTMKVEPIVTND